jgi:hypothetical protein
MKRFAFPGLAVVGLTAGCVVNSAPPPNNAPNTNSAPTPANSPPPAPAATPTPAPAPASHNDFSETQAPSEAPHSVTFSAVEGRPKGLHVSAPEAYWVWHEGKGLKWHVRTTTHSTEHRFQGFVQPDTGHLSAVRPTRLEWNDRVRASEKGISFDFHTNGAEDGFDFETTGQCVRFYLLIDGKAHPQNIHIGQAGVNPPHDYFKACP